MNSNPMKSNLLEQTHDIKLLGMPKGCSPISPVGVAPTGLKYLCNRQKFRQIVPLNQSNIDTLAHKTLQWQYYVLLVMSRVKDSFIRSDLYFLEYALHRVLGLSVGIGNPDPCHRAVAI